VGIRRYNKSRHGHLGAPRADGPLVLSVRGGYLRKEDNSKVS
jgi:hypothetical protein